MENPILRRDIEKSFKEELFERGKISVIYGPRQVGKTTFAKQILRDYGAEDGFFNCEDMTIQEVLMSYKAEMMYRFFSAYKIIVLDEAQTVPNIGKALKILIDAHPEMTIIATGSSSFDLANEINEPLTGRYYEYFMYPVSLNEMKVNFSYMKMMEGLESMMVYGGYPEVVFAENNQQKEKKLELLATSYLYKDILTFGKVKNSRGLMDILRALAYQVGSEVSFTELGQLVGMDKNTVMNYIRLLEQAFIIFRLNPMMSNQRNAIKRKPKFYFYDMGIMNSLLRRYNLLDPKAVGAIWENLMITERRKRNQIAQRYNNAYFWRLSSGPEVDYIEEYNGELHPYEFKYKSDKLERGARQFEVYNGVEPKLVNKENFGEFVLGEE